MTFYLMQPFKYSVLHPTLKWFLSSLSLQYHSLSQLTSLLKSCTKPCHLQQAHAALLTHGILPTSTPLLLSSYISHHLLDSALLLLSTTPNNPSSSSSSSSFLHNTAIRALSTNSHFLLSLRLYSNLHSPNKFSFPFALKSSAALSDPRLGQPIHAHVVVFGCASDIYCNAALIDMYSKCGYVETARRVFDRMAHRDLVSWTSMISGYARNGCTAETLEFFRLMRCSNVEPGRVGLLSAFSACVRLGGIQRGASFHGFAVRTGFEMDIRVATAIFDMYAKCGSLELAGLMFDSTMGKDVVCWSAMIACYGYHGLGNEAIGIFCRMLEDGVKPNHATFASLLSSCSHSGLLREGKEYFDSMRVVYGVEPNHNHYVCIVDILGRAGRLEEAQEIIEKMPMDPGTSIYGSLLGACQIHGDMELGERVADKLLELSPEHSGYYVLLSNIYAAKSRWSDVARVRKLMIGRCTVNKVPGCSLIDFD